MSFLNILGGIGAGLQQGSQFVQQKNVQDQRLKMQQERQDWLRQDNEQKTADRELTNWMDQQYRDVYARDDLDDMGKAFEYAKVIAPRAKREHLEVANKTANGLYQTFGRSAIEAMSRGDLTLLQKAADVKAPGTKIATDSKGDNIIVETPDGILQQIDRRGLLTNLALSDVYRTMQAEAADKAAKQSEAQSKIRKTDSEAVLNEAKALNQMAQANGRAQFIEDENGNLVPNPSYRATGRAGKAGKAAEATEEAVPSVDAGDVAKLMGNAEGVVLSRVAADAESMMMATPGLRKNPMMAIELARRLSLPDDDKAKLRPLPVKNPATGEWYMEFDEPTLGKIRLGRTGGGGIDPEKNLTSDQNEAKNQRALIQAQDEDWLAAVAQTAPPAVMGYLGPYLNGQQSPSELTGISDQDIAAVLNSPLAPQELKDKAMAAQLVKSRPGFFSTAQRINKNAPEYMDGRRPKPAFAPGSVPADKAQAVKRQYALDQREEVRNAAGSGPSASAEAYARADGDAVIAMMLLRTNDPTLKAEQAVKALQAIEEFPQLKSELKVSENELWALKLTAGGNVK